MYWKHIYNNNNNNKNNKYCSNTNSYITCDWYLTILYLSLVIMVDIIKKPSTTAQYRVTTLKIKSLILIIIT